MSDTSMFTEKGDEISSANSISSPPIGKQPLPNQNLYRDLFLRMNDGFAYCKVELDGDGKPIDYIFQEVNKVFRRLIGINNKQIIRRKATRLIQSQNQEFFECLKTCSTVALTGRSLTFEKRCSASDKWFYINAYCPKKGYFAMTIRDITIRKKTEKALKQSEKQYKKLANSITDPFFAVDSNLKIHYWNKSSEEFMGIKADDVLGKHFFDVFGKDKATKKAVRIYLGVMRRKKPRTITGKLPRGDESIFEIQVSPAGNGISVLAKDITERKKLQGTMEQYAKGLEELVKNRTEKLKNVERLAAIGETAGMIGHDIRNPLQSIISELYLSQDDLKALPEGEVKQNLVASINAIEEQTLYINKIVTDLQDYAKPLTPAIQEIDLEETLQAIISKLDIPDNVELSYSVEKPFPMLKTDPSFMKRILTNLALNGVQAMQEKSGGELSINAFAREKTIIVAVADTGPGIPDAVKEKIFKPLFTTKSKGQGFGLAVVKKLVEALGGNIGFETELGKGTIFTFELPLSLSGLA